MKLLTKDISERLLKNGRIREQLAEGGRADADFFPVVKLFTPDAQCTWLLTELDPDDPEMAGDLVVAALNQAFASMSADADESMGGVAGGPSLGGMLG